jgi:ATP-dependent Clp protease ATP-binding subunit ClpA
MIQSLHTKRVLSLDLAALLAGSGIRGQFEERFKALLADIDEEGGGVICFIDELREPLVKHHHISASGLKYSFPFRHIVEPG